MKKTKTFNDFLMDLMLENEKPKFHGVTELPFVLSERLKKLLKTIRHPIAKNLLKMDKLREDKKVTFVDLSNDDNSKFSLVNSNKAYDNMVSAYKDLGSELTTIEVKSKLDGMPNFDHEHNSPLWTKNRAEVKIGSFVGKVFPNEYKSGGDAGNDIESFVQSVIAKRISNDERFKIVKGEDIIKYYHENNYDVKHETEDSYVDNSSLARSCMRHGSCGSYVNFYAQNKDASMLILFSDVDGREDKIVGRAILWELSQPSGRTFMDRIYYRFESDMAMFKQYAEKQGWLYKKDQNMTNYSEIVDTKDSSSKRMDLRTTTTFKQTSYYPYMDTMKWFDIDAGFLTNDEDVIRDEEGDSIIFLESTGGGYDDATENEDEDEDRIYVEFYGESFDEEDLTYCEYGDEHRTHDDAIWLEMYQGYATERYVNNNMVYSSYNEDYIMDDDATHSEYHDTYIESEQAIDMNDGADGDLKDVDTTGDCRHENEIDNSVIYYQSKDGDHYYFDKDEYEDNFVAVSTGQNKWNIVYKHKEWDKDKLYKHDGVWYYDNDSGQTKDKITGQKRLWEQ